MIDLNELNKDFANQTVEIIRTKETLFNAAEEVIKAKLTLDDLEADLMAQGVEGKNAEERKANLRQDTDPARGRVEVAEEK